MDEGKPAHSKLVVVGRVAGGAAMKWPDSKRIIVFIYDVDGLKGLEEAGAACIRKVTDDVESVRRCGSASAYRNSLGVLKRIRKTIRDAEYFRN